MKILVISQYYYPEPFRVTDLCEELVKEGNEVTVVAGLPNYPMGKIYEGYRDKNKKNETINGVKVHRCFTIGRRTGAIWRFLNYYSFAISSLFFTMGLKENYDVVLVNQLSPVMMANAGIKYKKRFNKKLVLYCLDLWPASLAVGGVNQNSFIYKYFHKISNRIYHTADKILVTSKSFKQYFEKEFGISDVEYLPQYAECYFSAQSCKKEESKTTDLMFAGNIGAAQSVDVIIKTAKLTSDIENLRWHIVGDGSELENCKRLADEQGLKNVIFYGRKPIEEMPRFYTMADAMLLTMNSGTVENMTLPGKVQTYMMAAKPIIASVEGEAETVVKEANCGFCSPSNDADKFAQSVRYFYNLSKEEKTQMGINAKEYCCSNFDKTNFFIRLSEILKDYSK